tara:strand:+ start:45628 stop:48081 length:2454 start_codon:yes stop_codon:yes gene_type:complete
MVSSLKYTVVFAFLLFVLGACNEKSSIADFKTNQFSISVGETGSVISLTDLASGINYLSKDTSTYLMSIRVGGQILYPESASLDQGLLNLQFENNIEATIKVTEKESHLVFELTALTNKDTVELILWGPYQTTINKIIGETIGVARGEEYALGIQSLNLKTLGGYPWNESDRMPAFDIFRQGDLTDMYPDNDGSVLYRVEAGSPTKYGSSLQAYTRDRSKPRIVKDFDHEKIMVPPYEDGGVIGSKIALFGCPVEDALQNIGAIELAEGLPHPMIDGEWVKTSKDAAAAYLITSFTEDNVEQAIGLTKKAGLKYLYHYGKTFESWGHFDLFEGEFPNGMEGLRECVEKAEARGVKIGTHCLSNFITTNDPYVTPIPDRRLAKVGSSTITLDIDAKTTEIPIRSPDYFNQMKNNNLKTVMIGEELIRYGRVSDSAPWKLLDCQRGAFNTKASAHSSGKTISKLLDHGYKVFLTNADLTIEMSETLADLYNKTGLRQISFDGLEGNRSTGLGTYGESLMPYTWYNALSEDLKNHLIIDASRTTHFFWHIYTRMNWGEPWYAGFRESQTEYRFNNQAYFKRNFMPGMLGWFKMTSETSLEDMEWLLARSAGYEAGYALVADNESVAKNGNSDKILELIGDWEKLRISDSFSDAQKELMRDNSKEFTIERDGDDEWNWQEIHAEIYTHEHKVRQPGEPLYSSFNFENPGAAQTLNFILTANNSDVNNITFEINNYKKIQLPVTIKAGQILKSLSGKVVLFDTNWQVIKTLDIDLADFGLNQGNNVITVDCTFNNPEKEANLKVEIKSIVKGEKVVLNKANA